MFTIVIRIDTFLQSYSTTHQFYQVLQRMPSYRRISTNPFMQDSLTSIFAEQYIKILLDHTSTTLLVKRYESCFLFTFLLITFWNILRTFIQSRLHKFLDKTDPDLHLCFLCAHSAHNPVFNLSHTNQDTLVTQIKILYLCQMREPTQYICLPSQMSRYFARLSDLYFARFDISYCSFYPLQSHFFYFEHNKNDINTSYMFTETNSFFVLLLLILLTLLLLILHLVNRNNKNSEIRIPSKVPTFLLIKTKRKGKSKIRLVSEVHCHPTTCTRHIDTPSFRFQH